jgi:hypothetical protein
MYEVEMTTRVGVPAMPFSIDYATGIVSLGSCFSDEIGGLMRDSGLHIEQNPFGTLYNPASIAAALRRLMEDREVGEEDLVEDLIQNQLQRLSLRLNLLQKHQQLL